MTSILTYIIHYTKKKCSVKRKVMKYKVSNLKAALINGTKQRHVASRRVQKLAIKKKEEK
jgi:hypothetical protein